MPCIKKTWQNCKCDELADLGKYKSNSPNQVRTLSGLVFFYFLQKKKYKKNTKKNTKKKNTLLLRI